MAIRVPVRKRNAPKPEGARLSYVQNLAERYFTDANWTIVEKLEDFCAARGHTLLELAFSWLAAKPPVASVIAGATKPEQLDQNVKAVGWKLSAEDLAEVDKISAKA